MTRVGLVLAIALTIAACSGSDTVVAPLETPASSTVVPARTTELTTTTSTTTSAVETTTTTTTSTTIPDTTTTFLEVEVPATDPTFPSQVEEAAAFAEVFAAYEIAWAVRRSAIFEPENQELRDVLSDYYGGENLVILEEFLDEYVVSDERTRPNPEAPNSVELLAQESLSEDGEVAAILVCEILTEIVFEPSTGVVTDAEPTSYRSLAFLLLEGGVWRIVQETISVEYPGQSGCGEE